LPGFAELLATHGPFTVYRVSPTGYVALVRSAAQVSGSREDLYRASRLWLVSPLPGLGDHPLLARGAGPARVGAVTVAIGTGERGRVVSEELERQGWSATIAANQPAYALVKATYHPWWRAELDGVDVKTVAMAPGFVGIPVSAGEHRLRVEYRPPRWKSILAVLGPLLLVALAVAERRGGGRLARGFRSQKE
jgi:hypothetical protein